MIEVWNESDSDIEDDDADINTDASPDENGVVRIYVLFLFLWQYLFKCCNRTFVELYDKVSFVACSCYET